MNLEQGAVLVITSSIDYTVDYIIDKFPSVCFYRLNIDMFTDYKILIKNDGWEIRSASGVITSESTISIYYRKPMLPDLTCVLPQYHTMVQNDIINVINGLVDSFNGPVVTKPSKLRLTENKVYQLQMLTKCGVLFPQSVIGNTDYMDSYISSSEKIVKPITTGKIDLGDKFEVFQTNLLNVPVKNISLTPIYLQERIEKEYEVRITYFMEEIWPVRIDSTNKTDWRKPSAKNRYSKIVLSNAVIQLCKKIMESLELSFGTFDFIVTPNGDWIFLEVNPNGQWLWLEQELDLNISDKLVSFLKGGR